MQPMSSMQTTLLPGVTPGWNDPPPLGSPSSGSRLNRYRRVVDPSLSAAGGSPTPYAASPQQGMPMGMPQGMSPQPMQPMPQMQPVQQQYYAQPDYSMTKVAPSGAGDSSQEHQQQLHTHQPLPQQQLQPLQQQPSAAPPIFPPTQSVASPGPYPMSPYQQPIQMAQMVNITHHAQYDSGAYAMQAQQAQQLQQQQAAQMATHYYSNQPSTHSSPQQNGLSGSTDSSLVFNPPNAVPGEEDFFVDPLNYRPPTKAPGDVSLSGSALPGFLVKAAMKLHPSKSQGVQLGLKPLQGEIGEMSKDDPFIKKFNYVVDAVDREDCEDASRHLQEMLVSFPQQTLVPEGGTERKWVGAIKLLLKELPLRNATGRQH